MVSREFSDKCQLMLQEVNKSFYKTQHEHCRGKGAECKVDFTSSKMEELWETLCNSLH